jgi:PAS domain S-box-containing protein
VPELANFHGIFEQLPEGALLCNRDLVIVAHNPRFAEVMGLTPAEIVGKHVADAEQPNALACMTRALAGQPASYQGIYRFPGAPERAVRMRAAPVRDDEGRIRGAVVLVDPVDDDVYRDVTGSGLRSWPVDRAPLPSYTWQRMPDGGFVLRDYNAAALAITKGRIPSFVGKRAAQLYGVDGPRVEEDMRRCFERGSVTRPETPFTLGTTGETRSFTITYVAISTDTLIIYTEDVTSRVRLAEQLRQTKKMDAIGQLAAGLAHDFNNIVAAIDGASAVLATGLGPGSPHLREVEEIRLAGAHASSLLRQLLALSKAQVPPQGTVDLGETARGMESVLRRLVPDGIALSIQADEGLHLVTADATQMEQLVLNLALNARDAMPTGGRLAITASNVTVDEREAVGTGIQLSGDYVELCVADTGVGMDAATRERAFEPFFTTKAGADGTGLGLSTVYGIVRRSGGTVTLESEVGRGTTVRVRLPRARTRAEGVAEPVSPPPLAAEAGGRWRVLLVEDTGPVRRACRRTLASIGCDVVEAANDVDALQRATDAGRLDLLVSDVNIPEKGGRALYEALKARRPDLRVLYISGHTHDDMLRHGAVERGAPFLQKPFSYGELVSAVRNVLGVTEGDVAAAR